MPQTGHEDGQFRENMIRLIKRKYGDPDVRLITTGDIDFYMNWEHKLNSLPQVSLPPQQDKDGNLPYIPGMDGPWKL